MTLMQALRLYRVFGRHATWIDRLVLTARRIEQ
jgi:hypothetical protein